MTRFIFVISGKKQAGKDTFARVACDLLASSFRCARYALADPLKDIVVDLLGVPREWCYGEGAAKENETFVEACYLPLEARAKFRRDGEAAVPPTRRLTVREILQYVGTDLLREQLHPDIWAIATARRIDRDFAAGNDIAFITDARFPNELEVGRWVETPDVRVVKVRLLRDVCRDTHRSEIALDTYPLENYDHIVLADEPLDRYVGTTIPEILRWELAAEADARSGR